MTGRDDQITGSAEQPTRRQFLVTATAVAGGLVLGFDFPFGSCAGQSLAQTAAPAASAATPEITSWIVIHPDDTVVIRVARSDMGQGAFTALPMLVAEELECDWAKVRAEYASPAENLKRKAAWKTGAEMGAAQSAELVSHWGEMSTGGSRGTRDSQQYLREAGAMARIMLVEAAAKAWLVPVSECTVAGGVITHTPSGRKVTYGSVAAAAARIPPPSRVTLKDPKTWKICGKSIKQLTTPAKVNGSLQYAIDVRLPDMLHATIAQCPVFGGRLKGFDEGKIKAMPGLRGVFKLDDQAICVVADSYWQAKKALDALPVTWDEGPNAKLTSATIAELQSTGLTAPTAAATNKIGDAAAALEASAKRIEAEYNTPFLAHATMEPMNCTARIADGRVEVWVGTQSGEAALLAAAAAAGVKPEAVTLNKLHCGGGFGRRLSYHDPIRYAVLAAKRTGGRPVKLVYSREEDMTHDFYRPVSRVRFAAGFNEKGAPTALTVRIAGQSINAYHAPERFKDTHDPAQANGFHAADFGYALPNLAVDVAMRNSHVPVGVWRSVNSSQNSFYKESFIDEMAHAAGKDPFEFRRGLLAAAPRHKRVLEIAADKAGWSKPPAGGLFRGIAVENAYGSYQAVVAEVTVSDNGVLKVVRIVNAIDCGHAVNPGIIEQQMQGSVVMAMTAMLYGENTVAKGRIVETNFDSYPMMRIDQMPFVETHTVPSLDVWGGIGEAGVPPIAPAICNAIFAATGKRIRSLPLKHHNLAKA